jgi:Uma2 family endonuclease
MGSAPKLPFWPPLMPGEPMPAPSSTQQAMDRLFYPESDGKPIAENTLQFEWIEKIKGNLDALYKDDPDVFVAGDLLWYPVEGESSVSAAPDTLVVLGRPKGHRGSYLQWRENDVAPQVVFEVLSPGNTEAEMREKRGFYERYGVLEYYEYRPHTYQLAGYVRTMEGERLSGVTPMEGFVSPLLGVRFEREASGELLLIGPDGRPFVTYSELSRQRETEERRRLIAEEQREAAEVRAEEEGQRAERLAARLRALGIDPDAA